MHLKRKTAPTFLPIRRKDFRWAVKPSPGPHKAGESIPLLVILRDILMVARNHREAEIILARGGVKVDGVIRRDGKFPVGLMDVVEIPALNKAYRILPVFGKGFKLHPIGPEEREFKLCRIQDKTTVKGGHIQLNLHDGRNILLKVSEPRRPVEDVYKTRDSLKIRLSNLEILGHIRFEVGVLSLIIGGKNAGRIGRVTKISEPSIYGSVATLRIDGGELETPVNYVFPVGKEDLWISIPSDMEAE
jgi:small subunit ribosomal protein S4e